MALQTGMRVCRRLVLDVMAMARSSRLRRVLVWAGFSVLLLAILAWAWSGLRGFVASFGLAGVLVLGFAVLTMMGAGLGRSGPDP